MRRKLFVEIGYRYGKWVVIGPEKKFGNYWHKENNGNYEPENCRWATKKEQRNNQRSFDISSINVVEF